MSDFDKEAEREKLREKYERDKADRETTERMSDLLLKGATMTNAHCGTCGDPIFRHEGQEFCPTCETVLREADGPEATDTEDAAADETDPVDAPTAADRPAAGQNGADPTAADRSPAGADPSAHETEGSGAASGRSPATTPPAAPGADDRQAGTPPQRRPADGATPSPATGTDTHATQSRPAATEPQDSTGTRPLDSARASLTRTVNRLAAEAEASDDVDRTRAYLAATEAAADALAAVRDADR